MALPVLDLVHAVVARAVAKGDTCVDATVGNGHDLLFLARQVGDAGRVYGFDIQARAIRAAEQRLSGEGLDRRATLRVADHADASSLLPPQCRGTLAAVMFNLGYLPGGERALITRPDSTVRALEGLWPLVREGAVLSVVTYPGHPGGGAEEQAVREWIRRRNDALAALYRPLDTRGPAPTAYLLRKRRGAPQERTDAPHE